MGWNELSSEKENMFIKFLMFFTGPILYGESPSASEAYFACPQSVLRMQWLSAASVLVFASFCSVLEASGAKCLAGIVQ